MGCVHAKSLQSCLTVCDPHGLQHARLPYSSPSPRFYSNSCPLSQWCHPTGVPNWCHLLLFPLLLLPSIFPSIRVFSNESTLHIRWSKNWSSASASWLFVSVPCTNVCWIEINQGYRTNTPHLWSILSGATHRSRDYSSGTHGGMGK